MSVGVSVNVWLTYVGLSGVMFIVVNGAVASRTIVSVSVEMLPTTSRYWTRTVFVPSLRQRDRHRSLRR